MKWMMMLALAGLLPLAACSTDEPADQQANQSNQGTPANNESSENTEMTTVAFRLDSGDP